MDQKVQFIADYSHCTFEMSELCERYEVSRKISYGWLKRYIEPGAKAREGRSRTSLNRTPAGIESKIIEVRRQHSTCGRKKILDFLKSHH